MRFLRSAAAVCALVLTAASCGALSPQRSAPTTDTGGFFWETPDIRPTSLVPLDEIVSGGPPPDGIPPIDRPAFVTPAAATWLKAEEPVLVLSIRDDARAYPLQIMVWHEIVNDTVGGAPVVVTYCPLCNSAIVYERTVAGSVTTFGTSGRVYQSDLVMYDRATKSLWPQILGKAVVGPRIGTELIPVRSGVVSFADFRAEHPAGKVLSRQTGFDRDYGSTPYAGYDSKPEPFLFDGDTPHALPKIARVVGVRAGGHSKTYPLTAIRAQGDPAVVNDRVGGVSIVLLHRTGTASALDAPSIADGKDVGSTGVFERTAAGRLLTFQRDGGRIRDRETGSEWNLLGRATAGALKGARLARIDAVDTFWFAWAAFVPGSEIWSQ